VAGERWQVSSGNQKLRATRLNWTKQQGGVMKNPQDEDKEQKCWYEMCAECPFCWQSFGLANASDYIRMAE